MSTLPRNHVVPSLHCPACETEINMATTFAGKVGFRPGNLVVCSQCGSLLKVKDDNFVRVSRQEFDQMPDANKAIIVVIMAKVREAIGKQKNN